MTAAHLADTNPPRPREIARRAARGLLIVFYLVAGIAHLATPHGFVSITPSWVPDPALVVRLTGVAEIAGALGMCLPPRIVPHLRPTAAIGLALYALCVWPANFHHAFADIPLGGRHLSWWYHGPRLVLQPVIIWWPLWSGRVIDWPWRRR